MHCSPPSSPISTSPDASVISSSSTSPPPASPSPERPTKRRRWEVFAFRNANCQASDKTIQRWQEIGYVRRPDHDHDHDPDPDPDHAIEVQAQACEEELQDDAAAVTEPEGDSSESEAPSSDSSTGVPTDVSDADEPLFDSEEERFDESSDTHEDSDDEAIPLYSGCSFSRDEAMLDLLDDFLKNKQTQTSFKDHLATFCKYLPENHTMPKSAYSVFKLIKNFAPSHIAKTFYYCSECLLHIENIFQACPSCNSQSFNEFYNFDLEQQLKFYFENTKLADIIDNYKKKCSQTPDQSIDDICHGSEYRRVNMFGKYDITLMWNTDGVSLSKSSKAQLYPVLFVICEVPPLMRASFLLIAGVWYDTVSPPMNTLVLPFCKSLKKIDESGGLTWVHPDSKEEHKSVVNAPLVCADAPVRAGLQNIKSHNSKHACNYCEQKTLKIPLTIEEQALKDAGNKKIRRKRAFKLLAHPARLRTNNRMLDQARQAHLNDTSVKGVQGPSVLSAVPRLDLSTCLVAEYMHSVCLGNARSFLFLWVETPGPWYVGDRIDEIDNFMKNIKPPDIIARLPRAVSERCRWKASEFRSWLLYYSLVIAHEFLPQIYSQHWMLLVMAINLLLKTSVSQNDLGSAKTMIELFLCSVPVLYGPKTFVYNVHLLLHLPLCVERWGPLWATSAFQFENYNGILKQLIHGTKHRGKELVNSVRIAHGVEILRERVRKLRDHACNGAVGAVQCQLLDQGSVRRLTAQDEFFLLDNGLDIPQSIYARAKIKNETFTSLIYAREGKRVNYCVQYNVDGKSSFGDIRFFFSCLRNINYAIVKVLKTDQARMLFHRQSRVQVKHICPVRESGDLALVKCSSISGKVIKVNNFICIPPNVYEKNL